METDLKLYPEHKRTVAMGKRNAGEFHPEHFPVIEQSG
jgi:hypothetical protein